MPERVCTKCRTSQDEEKFQWEDAKRVRRRTHCRRCVNSRASASRHQKYGGSNDPQHIAKHARLVREARSRNLQQERWIWVDSRRGDKKKGHENDLTKEFIKEQIEKGCSYCGDTELRMTMDRIDNDRGHTRDNVVPACIRCNYLRRDMPYEAWLVVAPGMRTAREQGLFGDWTGALRKKRNTDP